MIFNIHNRGLSRNVISFATFLTVLVTFVAPLCSAISFSGYISGYISQNESRYHFFQVSYPSTVEIWVEWGTKDDNIDISLYDPYRKKVADSAHSSTNWELIVCQADTMGTYELEIYGYSIQTASSVFYSGEYTVTPIEYENTFDVIPRVASMTIDGTTYSTSQLPVAHDWVVGSSHSFSVNSIVPGQTGVQYVFTDWSDGSTSTSRTITVSGSANYIAQYKTQYYLTVESDHGDPQGQRWYDEGSTAVFSVTSPVSAGLGVKYVFDHWEGDVSASTPSTEIPMRAPHTVRAVWRTDYTDLYSIIGAIGIVGLVGAFIVVKILRGRKRPPILLQEAPAPPAEIPLETPVVKPVKPRMTPSEIDRMTYDYILQHKGVISISQAAIDLDITVRQLNASIKRLKKQRRIKGAHKVQEKT